MLDTTQQKYTTRATCRVCDSERLMPLFSLGNQYVNDFITKEEIGIKGHKCPIELVMCGRCRLVQLKRTAPQDFLYTRHYWYRSGVTTTMKNALRDVVAAARTATNLYEGATVLDIGSNDGTLLRFYPHWMVKTVGVEPATNLAQEGSRDIDVFINDFWSYDRYAAAGCEPAQIITAIGMLYDLEDPNQFVADIAKALAPDGVFIAQLMCLNNMLSTCDIGNLAHEHLEFYSLASLEFLLDKHGLEVYDVETNATNNQSYRFFIRHIGSPLKSRNPAVAAARIRYIRLEEEKLLNKSYYEGFFFKMEEAKKEVQTFIKKKQANGKKIWVYGASTKGNVLLQYFGLDHHLIDGAAERSPEKFDRYTIGTNIPILSESEMREAKPDYCLVLPYTFIDEFVKRESQEAWRLAGGKFIVPLPKMKVL